MKVWINLLGFLIGMLAISGQLSAQDRWKTSRCNRYAPTLDRILINSCTSYEPDEYILFHTNQGSFSPNSDGLKIQVNVSNGPYLSNYWTSNTSELNAMNEECGCDNPLFIDPFEPPYNGVIPPYSNVIVFVQQNPSFSGSVSGLCSTEAVFVLFGNFTHYFSKSMFGNTCGSTPDCERNIEVQMGSCKYDIVYHPDNLPNKNGAYIQRGRSSVQYGTASQCKPVFYKFPKTPNPQMNRTEISLCSNSSPKVKFSAFNGNEHTAWYTDLKLPPVAQGPTFFPPLSLFPPLENGKMSSRKIYVVNEYGGRSGNAVELKLISLPPPATDMISLICPESTSCNVCRNEKATLILDIGHGSDQGGYPYSSVTLSNGTTDTIIQYPALGKSQFLLPVINSPSLTYTLTSIKNQYGCIETTGFAQNKVTLFEQAPLTGYLPEIPDFCSTDPKFTLPVEPGNVRGDWKLNEKTVLQIDPGTLASGKHNLNFIPDQPCTNPDSTTFNIHLRPTASIALPIMNCNQVTYTPQLTYGSSKGGTWRISPMVPINPKTGEVLLTNLKSKEEYTFTYTVFENDCSTTSQNSITMEDCSCSINVSITNITCQDNNTPSDPGDDNFTFQIEVTGQNTGKRWTTSDGLLTGLYGTPVSAGPFPIADGPRTLIIRDEEQKDCSMEVSIDPPSTCSSRCAIEASITDIQCQDNNTPSDPADDNFTFQIEVTGQNTAERWTTSDGLLSGLYSTPVSAGPFPIADGPRTLHIRDEEQKDCSVELSIDPPSTCSSRCDIEASITDIQCQDNNTPSDPADDNFTFQIEINGQNTGKQWTSSDGLLTGLYGTPVSAGAFPIADGPHTLIIRDEEQVDCSVEASIDPPSTCSHRCDIEASITDIQCQDNNTPSDPADDNFTFQIEVTGQNTAERWTTSDGLLTGLYGTPVSAGAFPIADGPRTLIIRDEEQVDCSVEASIDPPSTCSHRCDIEASITDIQCQDNNTPSDPADDNFTFQIEVTGQNTAERWTTSDGLLSGLYGTPVSAGPFPIADGPRTLHIRDEEQKDCSVELSIDPPSTCSSRCDIEASITDIQCQDNNTPSDPADDNFTFQIEVTGQNTGKQWTSSDGLLTGLYGTPVSAGPFPIDQGPRTLHIRDEEQKDCSVEVSIDPPSTCSLKCKMKIEIADTTCQIDPFGINLLYLSLHIATTHSDQTGNYWVYHRDSLLDIIPGTGQVLLGPFYKEDVGENLKISYNMDSSCLGLIAIPSISHCLKPCSIHIKDFSITNCPDETQDINSEAKLSVQIYSDDYPLVLEMDGHFVGNILDSAAHSFPLTNSNKDSLPFTIKRSVDCELRIRSPNPCFVPFLVLPNAFTPNQDGLNDQWEIQTTPGISIISIEIYDKWGNRIFSQKEDAIIGNKVAWDGMYNNFPVMPGHYIYQVTWKSNSKTDIHIGDIMVIR